MPTLLPLLCCCLLFSGCDIFYGVVRTAPVPVAFDAAGAESLLRGQPGFVAMHAQGFDGTRFCCPFERGEAIAVIEYEANSAADRRLSVVSLWVGRPPPDPVFRASWLLQRELVELLANRVQGFPSPSTFAIRPANLTDEELLQAVVEPETSPCLQPTSRPTGDPAPARRGATAGTAGTSATGVPGHQPNPRSDQPTHPGHAGDRDHHAR